MIGLNNNPEMTKQQQSSNYTAEEEIFLEINITIYRFSDDCFHNS